MENTGDNKTKTHAEEEIRQIAYRLWFEEGCPDGRHHEHWLRAQEIWHAQQAATHPKVPAARAAKTASAPGVKKPAPKAKPRRWQPASTKT